MGRVDVNVYVMGVLNEFVNVWWVSGLTIGQLQRAARVRVQKRRRQSGIGCSLVRA